MLSPRQIRYQIEKLAERIGAEPDELPTYGSSRDFGRPHIEVDEVSYHWVVVERGEELERRSFADLDDLLYTVFSTVTHSIASRWEIANRVPNQDSRRLLFRRQIELLSALNPSWASRWREHHRAVLGDHPYSDAVDGAF